jgi:beta-1,4-mannosyltransferase
MTSIDSSTDVVFLPDWRVGNPYQSLLAQALLAQGIRVSFYAMPSGLFALNRLPTWVRRNKTLHLHWVNDLIAHLVWPQQAWLRWFKRWCLGLDVWLLRARGTRVVWTIHNLVAHESVNPDAELAARRLLARCSTRLILHSEGALKKIEATYGFSIREKAYVIPHGNYNGCYPMDDSLLESVRRKLSLEAGNVNLLFFGTVRRYKGVHELVKLFREVKNPNIRLLIVGQPNQSDLQQEIIQAAEGDPRVVHLLEFVPDAQVAPIFSLVDAVIIPFERTLTSGSTVLAMSLGKATLLPIKAKVLNLTDESSSIFFENSQHLLESLENLDKADLLRRGLCAKEQANELDWGRIAQSTAEVYQGCSAISPA